MASYPGFATIYNQLNPAQKNAVDAIDGPVMVMAGPGTGKTQVLAARIANILLKTDTNPSAILALTFTESAAKNMRERLVSLIGKTGYYVQIHTFHSFCTDIIQSFPEYFPIDRDSQPLSELERYDLLQQIIDELPLVHLKPLNAPYFYLRDLVRSISDLKREGISVAEFTAIVAADQADFDQEVDSLKKTEKAKREKQLGKNHELIQVYQQYQERLRANVRFDFDDMISLVVHAFQDNELLLMEYQEKVLYFLVDEYQDTNSAQNKVVDLLASFWGDQANVFVVGDPNQAIYRFQGASLENVVGFTKRYPTAQVITLDTGYRSPQTIYSAAADLITNNHATTAVTQLKLDTALTSIHPGGDKLAVYKAPSQTLESVYIACAIERLIKQGVNPAEIAVLYRNNSDAAELSVALDKWNIAYEIDGGNNVLDVLPIQQLLNLFKVIGQQAQSDISAQLYEVMKYEWLGLPPVLVMQVARAAGQAKCSITDLISSGPDLLNKYLFQQTVTPLEFQPLITFLEQLVSWHAKESQLTLTAWFELVITESGFMTWIKNQAESLELLNAVNSLFREIKALSSGKRDFGLAELLQVIATLELHHLPISLEDLNITDHAVRLSTVHKAKGQEWEYVFIARCVDGKWGNAAKRQLIPLPAGILKNSDLSLKERNEDERRLFYVAITRAKKQVLITYPETIISENRSKAVVGSLFIEEIKDHWQPVQDELSAQVIEQAENHLVALLQPTTKTPTSATQRAFFQHLVTDFKLSVSALNTYLRSPQDFVDAFLLRVPRTKTPALAFGTAAHAALELLFKHLQNEGEWLPLAPVLTKFADSLAKEDLTTSQLEVRLQYGQEVLSAYYQHLSQQYQQLPMEPVFIERFFGSGWSRTMLDDIALTGRIDRVDWLDKAQQTVRVIDYKTGKTRTVGDIEGATLSAELSAREQALPAGIRGPYKRQLLFYKLLAQLDASFQPSVTSGSFEFLEPDKVSGKLISRQFELPDEEVEDLKSLIKEVMAEIRGLAFLDQLE